MSFFRVPENKIEEANALEDENHDRGGSGGGGEGGGGGGGGGGEYKLSVVTEEVVVPTIEEKVDGMVFTNLNAANE